MPVSTASTTSTAVTSPGVYGGLPGRLARRRLGGFTLLELIVVIVVLGILAALTVPAFRAVTARTALQTAEQQLAAHVRAAHAHAALGSGALSLEDFEATAPGATVAADLALAAPSQVAVIGDLFGYSAGAGVVHVGLEAGGSAGLAVYVPEAAGCAFARGRGGDGALEVETWSVRGVAVFVCTGQNALDGDPSGDGGVQLLPPATPQGLTVTGGLATWQDDPDVELWAVLCAGRLIGVTPLSEMHVGDCPPEDVTVIAAPPGSGGGTPPPAGGGDGDTPPPAGSDGGTLTSHTGPVWVSWPSTGGGPWTVEVSTDGGTSWTPVASDLDEPGYLDTDTTGPRTYRSTGPSGSVPAEPTPATAPPSPVTVGSPPLTITITGANAQVSWTEVADSPTAPLTGYRLYRQPQGGQLWASGQVYQGTAASYLDQNLNAGTWCWRVSAYGPAGESPLSGSVCATVQASLASTEFVTVGNAIVHHTPTATTQVALTSVSRPANWNVSTLRDVTYHDGVWYAVGGGSAGAPAGLVLSSTNGTSWQVVWGAPSILYLAEVVDGRLYVGGNGGFLASTATPADENSWTTHPLPANNGPVDGLVRYGDTWVISYTFNAAILTGPSLDNLTSTGVFLANVTELDGRLAAVSTTATSNSIRVSTNGTTWTPLTVSGQTNGVVERSDGRLLRVANNNSAPDRGTYSVQTGTGTTAMGTSRSTVGLGNLHNAARVGTDLVVVGSQGVAVVTEDTLDGAGDVNLTRLPGTTSSFMSAVHIR